MAALVQVHADKQAASVAVAATIRDLIRRLNAEGRTAVFGLATGSTPLPLYAELVRLRLIYGAVSPVAGRSYPDVTIQRVSRRGVKSVRKMRLATDRPDRRHLGWNVFLIGLFLSVVTLVLLVVLKR